MKLGSIGSSLVRWFKRPATSAPPQMRIEQRPEGGVVGIVPRGTAITSEMLYQLAAAIPKPSIEQAPSRLEVKPPADPLIDNASWEWWELARGNQQVPGWAYCRFAARVGDKAAFAFGYVRGSFGIWQRAYRTCTGEHPNVIESQQLLTNATHLLTGHGVGIFESLKLAAEACELADRVADEWATEKTSAGLNHAIDRAQRAWAGAGIVPSHLSHAHDYNGEPDLIMVRSIESVMEGKPERLS